MANAVPFCKSCRSLVISGVLCTALNNHGNHSGCNRFNKGKDGVGLVLSMPGGSAVIDDLVTLTVVGEIDCISGSKQCRFWGLNRLCLTEREILLYLVH